MAVFVGKKEDTESGGGSEKGTSDVSPGYVGAERVIRKEDLEAGDSLYAKLQRVAGRYGVEQRGIERVPEEEKTDTSLTRIGTVVCIIYYGSSFSLHVDKRNNKKINEMK
jgi:hypothetical protein